MSDATTPITALPAVDLAIVGSGPIGALVAREVRERAGDTRIAMVEVGPRTSTPIGKHVLTSGSTESKRTSFESLRAGIQLKYVDSRASDDAEWAGVVRASVMGEQTEQLPGASLGWNVGGLGIHWAGACPRPYGAEIPLADTERWEELVSAAERAFRVTRDAFPARPSHERIERLLNEAVPNVPSDRRPGRMPLAGHHDENGLFHRTGPADILPRLAEPDAEDFTLYASRLCERVEELADGSVVLHLRDVVTGERSTLAAKTVVLAADVYRTPQLLFASGIRPEALGRYINDHVFLLGSMVLPPADDPERPEGEPFTGIWWVPSSGDGQPFHCQMVQGIDPVTGELVLGLALYVVTQLQADNRLNFSETEVDAVGMPRFQVDYSLSAADEALVERGRAEQRRIAEIVGTPEDGMGGHLPLGASLHVTGTVRIGEDPSTSVADLDGLVHGTSSIYVAGSGAVPTALTCNATLTAAGLAVGTARAVATRLVRR